MKITTSRSRAIEASEDQKTTARFRQLLYTIDPLTGRAYPIPAGGAGSADDDSGTEEAAGTAESEDLDESEGSDTDEGETASDDATGDEDGEEEDESHPAVAKAKREAAKFRKLLRKAEARIEELESERDERGDAASLQSELAVWRRVAEHEPRF